MKPSGTLMAKTEIAGQGAICLFNAFGKYVVTYDQQLNRYEFLRDALNNYNQCCLHAEQCAGWHDDE